MNYEQDIIIDESALDIEWIDQASLALKYGRHWAVCRQELQQAEENIKLVRAELVKEAFADAEEIFGNPKPTAPAIESYYRTHHKHIQAKKDWVEAQFESNVAEIAYKEISYARKSALENLVKLHGQQYFAGPSVPRNIEEEV
ncbi:MAG: hypothetical protein E3J78_02285, partial [Candidatus Cloacimonadota bacterium]